MEEKKIVITQEGYKEYRAELADLKKNKRAEVAEKLKSARAQGDLSENAEYDLAKDEQKDIEARIQWLENVLKNAEVTIGKTVRIQDLETKEELVYKIVGSTEANILKNKISLESPVGRALASCNIGETVLVNTEAGEIRYKILEFVEDPE